MTRRGSILLVFVLVALLVGFTAGWRAHITYGAEPPCSFCAVPWRLA